MTALKFRVLMFSLACYLTFHVAQSEHEREVDVECTYKTSFCSCPVEADVCNFKFTVQAAMTFTKYVYEGRRSDNGKVWYLDQETGELEPIPPSNDFNHNCLKDSNENCTEAITVDGNTFRKVITINTQLPGPTLQVHYNQIVSVEVTNLLTSEDITIHWHGMHQVNTPWMDGQAHVSQYGITPGSTFRYIFRANPAGTHWYHSHTGTQRVDGLFGALIVLESSDTLISTMDKIGTFIDAPESHTLTFLEWEQRSPSEIFTRITSGSRFLLHTTPPDDTAAPPPIPIAHDGIWQGVIPFNSGLINGKGRHPEIPYNKTILSVFDVDYSETYRFRLIGAQSGFGFRVSIDGHRMKVIATDGFFVNPIIVDFLFIYSGERYDILLETKSRPTTNSSNSAQNYIIRAETIEANQPDHSAEAILHYGPRMQFKPSDYEEIVNNSPRKSEECGTTTNCTMLNCPFKNYPSSYGIQCIHVDSLRLLNPLPTDDNLPDYQADQRIFVNLAFEGTGNTGTINNRFFKTPSAPFSLADRNEWARIKDNEACKALDEPICDNSRFDYSLRKECVCTHVIDVKFDQSVQMVFTATGADTSVLNFRSAHPVHLHGHSFHVLKIGFGEYDQDGLFSSPNTDIECLGDRACAVAKWRNDPFELGLEGKIPNDAPLKDTVTLPAGGYVVAYIKSNNPGFWGLHCHIAPHFSQGMAVVINEGFDQQNPPPDGMRQDGNFTWTAEDFETREARLVTAEATTSPTDSPSTSGHAPCLHCNFIILFALLIIMLIF